MTTMTSRVSIDRIHLPDEWPSTIHDMRLDRPVAGGEWIGSSFEIAGWVVGTSSPVTLLEIRHDEQLIRRLPVCRRRIRVAKQFPDAPQAETSGFVGTVSTLGLPSALRLELVATHGDGSSTRTAVLEGRRAPVRPGCEPALQPVLVTTLGRMASTWVMSLLAAHPQIVALRKYPYECKTAKFWSQVLACLAEPTMQPRDTEKVHADRWWLGSNSFFQPELIREPRPGVGLYSDRMAEVCQRNIDSWYAELAFHQVKENVCYFAEKMNPNRLLGVTRELYPNAKEIFLVRDFRDWISSILAFDAKRGFHGFGRRKNESTLDYVRRHGQLAFRLHAHWREQRGAAHLVRYEDLVGEPEATLRSLFEYLEVDATRDCVSAALDEARTESETYRHHRTSSSARSSIGRWRKDLDADVRECVETLFADVLQAFAYEDATGDAVLADPGAEVATEPVGSPLGRGAGG